MSETPQKTMLRYRTVVLSDVHLGAPDCQIGKVNHFLNHVHCEKLILNGDIIDGWSLGRRGGWTNDHTRFLRIVLRKIEMQHLEVVYLRGNHDDFLDRFLPLVFGSLRITDRHIHEGPRGRYLVLHGDVFDAVTKNSKLLAVVGDVGYQTLMRLNHVFNRYRKWRGKGYFSLSKAIKARTKSVVNYISRFEKNVEHFAKREGCGGFICGHIHTPENKYIGSIHYLNSGDWVESNTALVEYPDGRWEVLGYETFCERLAAGSAATAAVRQPRQTAMIRERDGEQRPAVYIPA